MHLNPGAREQLIQHRRCSYHEATVPVIRLLIRVELLAQHTHDCCRHLLIHSQLVSLAVFFGPIFNSQCSQRFAATDEVSQPAQIADALDVTITELLKSSFVFVGRRDVI